jgi:hypothetical protein
MNTIRFLEERLTVASIMQPTAPSLGVLRAKDLLALMDENSFDHAAVADHNDVSRYVSRTDLQVAGNKSVLECSHIISASNIVSDTCPLADALPRIIQNEFLLVLRGKAIDHIVTAADLDRFPVAIYFLSVLHAFEESLTTKLYALTDAEAQKSLEAWVASIRYPEQSTNEGSKLADSLRSFERKKRNRQELRLVNCLHLLHKIQLLQQSQSDWWKPLNCKDAAEASSSLNAINTLRNTVAHGDAIATSTTGWREALRIVRAAQRFAERLAGVPEARN